MAGPKLLLALCSICENNDSAAEGSRFPMGERLLRSVNIFFPGCLLEHRRIPMGFRLSRRVFGRVLMKSDTYLVNILAKLEKHYVFYSFSSESAFQEKQKFCTGTANRGPHPSRTAARSSCWTSPSRKPKGSDAFPANIFPKL